jgi:dTDP-glucose pyrophosphorylase
MLNIVIPMAGAGSRFSLAGYKDPKPLIEVNNIPMIQLVINNLKPKINHRFIFICQNKHIEQYDLINKLKSWSSGAIVIGIDDLTEGAACTVLCAKEYINSDDQLMIANSDQFVDCSIDHYLSKLRDENLDGLIMTMTANDPKWSFVEVENYFVKKVVEKEVISNEATVGIYNFKHGKDFVLSAENMINSKQKVNNEYYVAPVYNDLIVNNKKIGIYNVGSEANGMYGLGIPSDLELFLSLPVSKKVILK